MHDKQKRKKIFVIIITWISVLLSLAIALNVSMCFNLFDGGGCISVAFDKLPMLFANKAVLLIGEDRYEISDINLVHNIVKETMVATNTDFRYRNQDKWIEIYCGNKIVRRIHWVIAADDPLFIVYRADYLHWIWPSFVGDGLVHPSDELITQINTFISASDAAI